MNDPTEAGDIGAVGSTQEWRAETFGRYAAADRRIREELGHLLSHGWHGEWKVHDLDQPADLRSRLEAKGLTAHHVEALMVLNTADAAVKSGQEGGIVAEVASGAQIEEIAQLQEEVWQCRLPWLARIRSSRSRRCGHRSRRNTQPRSVHGIAHFVERVPSIRIP
jgi:hypothetical protein